MKTIIVDIDGTIADFRHRMHHILDERGRKKAKPDWEAFNAAAIDDVPIQGVIDLLNSMKEYTPTVEVIFMTGRNESMRVLTIKWLEKYGTIEETDIVGRRIVDGFYNSIRFIKLMMRKEDDHRPDYMIKEEYLHQLRSDGHNIILAIEDRQQCVDMWRNNGIVCLQNAPLVDETAWSR